jgi:hypothetical protein
MVKPTVAPVRRRANSFVMACSVSADANFRGAITVLAESKLMLTFCAFAVGCNSKLRSTTVSKRCRPPPIFAVVTSRGF